MLIWVIFPIIGIVAGLLSGLTGVGGGTVLIPLFITILPFLTNNFDIILPLALGSSLACSSFTLFTSSLVHKKKGNIQLNLVYKLLPGLIFGAILSPYVVHIIPAKILHNIIAVMLLILAINTFINYKSRLEQYTFSTSIIIFFGIIIGLCSAFSGLSGAVFVTPFLLFQGVPVLAALGTSAFCGFLLSITGAISYSIVGYKVLNLPYGCIGYVYWPAVFSVAITSIPSARIAAKISYKIPKNLVKRMLASVMAVFAVKMLFFKL